MSNVVCIKIINGEELIGDLIQEGEKEIRLKDVASVMMMPSSSSPSQVNLGLLPFLPYAEEKAFSFKLEHVVVKYAPSTDLLNNYNRLFGSGIQIARSV